MGWRVVKHENRYLVWSSVVDAPITLGMSKADLCDFWHEEFGRSGERSLERQLSNPSTLEDEWIVNRAGKGETRLSVEQLIQHYFVNTDPELEPPMGEEPEEDE